MKQRRVVWLDISASYSHSSLALPAIEACRGEDDGYDWSVVRGTINSDIYSITRTLFDVAPTHLAATLWLFNHEVVVKICERLKVLLPDTVITLGGPEFNGDNEEFLRRNRFVDYAFRGEGEIEFHRLLAGCAPSQIRGLCYIDTLGQYCDNAVARVEHFETLPPPESSRFFNFDSPFVQIESSRGCFNECAFCVSGGDKPVRVKSIADVEKRIDTIKAHGVHDVRILDRTFNYSPQRAEDMLKLFARYQDMNFHLEIHPALLTDRLCQQLKEMPYGVLHIEAGMQSLDDLVIKSSGRLGSTQAAIDGVTRLCQMDGFETHTDLIAGLPHYSLEQIYRDVRTLAQMQAGEIQLELLKLLPGTRMRRDAEKLGIKYNPSPPYEVLQTPAITLRELDSARLLSKLIDKFYNAKVWQRFTRHLIVEREGFLEQFINYLAPMEILERPLSMERCGKLLYDFCRQQSEFTPFIDDLSLAWIDAGLSIRAEQAGRVCKAEELPQGVERRAGAHYYLWQGKSRSYIYCIDRSVDHSRPIERWSIQTE